MCCIFPAQFISELLFYFIFFFLVFRGLFYLSVFAAKERSSLTHAAASSRCQRCSPGWAGGIKANPCRRSPGTSARQSLGEWLRIRPVSQNPACFHSEHFQVKFKQKGSARRRRVKISNFVQGILVDLVYISGKQ